MDSNNNLNTELNDEVVQVDHKSTIFSSTPFKIGIVLALILVSFIGYWFAKNISLVNSYNDKVYPGAYILNQDLSSLSDSALHEALVSLLNDISNKKLSVSVNDNKFDISYKDLDANINYEELESEILSFGKSESFFKKLNLIKNPENREYNFEVLFNEEKLTNFVADISNNIDYVASNASIDISGGYINISNDRDGLKLKSEDLLNTIKNSIKDMNAPDIVEIKGETEAIKADITAESLSNVASKISSFSTNYKAGPSGTNLQLAAANIDNIIVMPGETFSTEKAIGPTTIENGFVEANTYVGGEVVPGVGGGVCQVASTLYNTMLRAGIIPTERQNHMMPVSYVPMGLDATLADNLIDLKFVNDFDYPIVVNSYASGGTLTIEFWSNPSVTNGITYEPVAKNIDNLNAETYLYGYDSNGNLVVNQRIDRSTYQPLP